ncbi:alpha/beta hydrolase [Sphingomonas sp.]|uniref:alpha/beta hydrolase n=1 Tax=Sphingomonas sp. TaxID=28214 RepID=UPI003B3A1260
MLLALAFICAAPCTAATWQPAPGTQQMALWPGAPPHMLPVDGPETMRSDPNAKIGGKTVIAIDRVSHPTLTFYRPRGRNTGAAVLVYPGGGFWILAMDLEGSDVCDWLTAKGIACILVKYRVPGSHQSPRSGPYPLNPVALEDAQRAIAITRFHARAWGIDPHKIGVLGFSAGGHLVAATSTLSRIYAPVDVVDQTSVRPDFGIALYPGHLWIDEDRFQLNPDVPVSGTTPPQFIVQNEDDPVDSVNNALVYYIALQKAGVPTELHLYAKGGHAFGLRHDAAKPATDWPVLAERWLQTIGMLP